MRHLLFAVFILNLTSFNQKTKIPDKKDVLSKASRENKHGWIYVHLEGSPYDIGYQHGYLLANDIDTSIQAVAYLLQHDTHRDWQFYRSAAKNFLWDKLDREYKDEINGIVEGLQAEGKNYDSLDLTAYNATEELAFYYAPMLDNFAKAGSGNNKAPGNCSAFIATGSYTKDGRIVIGHNNWTDYLTASRWNIIFDVMPAAGQHFIMDGMPGLIHSGDDFGINAAGMMITETTISNFHGFDEHGIPEFVRARKAMQYSKSIDDFARIMKDGNNGGYANNWLIADRKTNEIASLELGLKNVVLKRSNDGFFVGSNFPADPKLAKEETDFDLTDKSLSQNTRHARWLQLMEQNKGKIDVAAGQRFLADHVDMFDGRTQASERTLCGHIEASPRGMGTWQAAYAPAGSVQNKI